jgi:hypothetical protein
LLIARIAEQQRHAPVIEGRHAGRVEALEHLATACALAEDRAPAQTGLRAFEHQHLELMTVVVRGHAPLLIVTACSSVPPRAQARRVTNSSSPCVTPSEPPPARPTAPYDSP